VGRQAAGTKHGEQKTLASASKEDVKALKDAGWASMMVTKVAGPNYVFWQTLNADLEVGER